MWRGVSALVKVVGRASQRGNRNVPTARQQGAAPDRLQLRSFLAALPAAGELSRWAAALAWLHVIKVLWPLILHGVNRNLVSSALLPPKLPGSGAAFGFLQLIRFGSVAGFGLLRLIGSRSGQSTLVARQAAIAAS